MTVRTLLKKDNSKYYYLYDIRYYQNGKTNDVTLVATFYNYQIGSYLADQYNTFLYHQLVEGTYTIVFSDHKLTEYEIDNIE